MIDTKLIVVILSVILILFLCKLNKATTLFRLWQIDLKSFQKLLFRSLLLTCFNALMIIIRPYMTFNMAQDALFFIFSLFILFLFFQLITRQLLKTNSFYMKLNIKQRYFKWLYRFVLLGSIVLYSIGYKNMANLIAFSSFKTIVIVLFYLFFVHLISRSYHLLTHHEASTTRLRKLVVSESNYRIPELKLLMVISLFFLSYTLLIMLVEIWDITDLTSDNIKNIYDNGFTLFNIHLIPKDLINAIIIYAFLGLAIRFVAYQTASKNKRHFKSNQIHSINPIMMNIGFIIAGIIALLAAGINLTGLAIIVSALSVGIGLGLKSIINNFISGVILLIEKPIKVGDRILVGDSEGIVTRIRIRATEIKTRDRSDILIPNEDIITNKVTNYMLREAYWRIHCEVGVAYDSNIQEVKDLLLQAAKENEEVIHDDPNHTPNVLFKSFGDSSLRFQLRCVIKNVNRKNFIISDLNTRIEELLRNNHIDIPFPQREITIKPAE